MRSIPFRPEVSVEGWHAPIIGVPGHVGKEFGKSVSRARVQRPDRSAAMTKSVCAVLVLQRRA